MNTSVLPSVPFARKEPRKSGNETYRAFRVRQIRALSDYNDYRAMWMLNHLTGKQRRFAQAFWNIQIQWLDL